MARKQKPLPYKRGDEVIYISLSYGVRLTKGVVTAVRNDKGIVYVQSVGPHGNTWKDSFGRECGRFQQNPHPIWMLRHLNGENFAALQKGAEHAQKLYHKYNQDREEMLRQLDNDTADWKRCEYGKRMAKLTDSFAYTNRVAARMGFKKPRVQKFNF